MDSSTDISSDFIRSFGEYDSSGLEIDSANEYESNHPLTKSIIAVMENKLKSNGTLTSAQSVVQMINEVPGSEIRLPTNRNTLKQNAKMRYERKFFVFCEQCNELCNTNGWCKKCESITTKTKTNFIVHIPIEQQIKNCFEKHFDDIMNYMNREKNGDITDTDDGHLYNLIRLEHPDSIILSFTVNIDGAQVHNSRKNSMWPVQLYQNYLPPHLRFKTDNVILATLYFGREKPNTSQLLYPLCEDLQALAMENISFFRFGEVYHCVPIILFCSADLPAKAMFSGLKLYSGRSACTACMHEGVSITDHLNQKYTRYVQLASPPTQRTHESIISAVSKLSSNRSK